MGVVFHTGWKAGAEHSLAPFNTKEAGNRALSSPKQVRACRLVEEGEDISGRKAPASSEQLAADAVSS